MAVARYEAKGTFAFPRKDGITVAVVEGNVYDMDLGNVPAHLHDEFAPAGVKEPKQTSTKKPTRKPAAK